MGNTFFIFLQCKIKIFSDNILIIKIVASILWIMGDICVYVILILGYDYFVFVYMHNIYIYCI